MLNRPKAPLRNTEREITSAGVPASCDGRGDTESVIESNREPASPGASGPQKPKPQTTSRYQQMSGFSMGLSLAIEFAAAVALFWFLGFLLDEWLGTEPWGQVILGVVGWIG